jgi:hypothetical protein
MKFGTIRPNPMPLKAFETIRTASPPGGHPEISDADRDQCDGECEPGFEADREPDGEQCTGRIRERREGDDGPHERRTSGEALLQEEGKLDDGEEVRCLEPEHPEVEGGDEEPEPQARLPEIAWL